MVAHSYGGGCKVEKALDYYLGDSKKGTKRTIPAFEFNLACKRVLEATKVNGFDKRIC